MAARTTEMNEEGDQPRRCLQSYPTPIHPPTAGQATAFKPVVSSPSPHPWFSNCLSDKTQAPEHGRPSPAQPSSCCTVSLEGFHPGASWPTLTHSSTFCPCRLFWEVFPDLLTRPLPTSISCFLLFFLNIAHPPLIIIMLTWLPPPPPPEWGSSRVGTRDLGSAKFCRMNEVFSTYPSIRAPPPLLHHTDRLSPPLRGATPKAGREE